MYQALYRKYRPTNFDDVCGQDHITSVLKTQLQKGRVSHAYMFCGSRGTGKTTCAKILAKAVNCENLTDGQPCNQCSSCLGIQEERILDVVEMDAASNNGVDHIRRLCDEVQFLPSETKKRVYIIDEVHMLSTNAFNALLKTIEEPPEHVLFILATTEMNDIPATIMSRCQRFDFKRLSPEVITDRLCKIAEAEQIKIDRKACSVIARLSDGAMRDALSLLEACQGYEGTLDVDRIHSILGLGERGAIFALARALANRDAAAILDQIRSIYERHSDFKEVVGELIGIYRDLFIVKTVSSFEKYVQCYENELEELKEIAEAQSIENLSYQIRLLEEFYVSFDHISSEKMASTEILFLRLCAPKTAQDIDALKARVAILEEALQNGTAVRTERALSSKIAKRSEPEREEQESKSAESKPSLSSPISHADLHEIVKIRNLLQQEPFIKHWLEQIEFSIDGDKLVLSTGNFIRGIVGSDENRQKILAIANRIVPNLNTITFRESVTQKEVKSDLDEL